MFAQNRNPVESRDLNYRFNPTDLETIFPVNKSDYSTFNITVICLLFGFVAVPEFGTVIVPLKCMYLSIESHKLEFSFEV